MSTKSLFLQTAAMLAMASTGEYAPLPERKKQPSNNAGFNKKKCKSCAKYRYREGSICCCHGNRCACSKYVSKKK